MSLAQWTEPKPCALSVPRFVRIPLYDAAGNKIPGEFRTKRISKPSCESGLAAITSVSLDGKAVFLCPDCSVADARVELGVAPVTPARLDPAAPQVQRDGDLVLVRVGRDTLALQEKLSAAGWRMKPRTRTVRQTGFATCRVQVWERS